MKDSYQNAKLYASFMGDKVKDILNHKITAKDGLVALVASAQLLTPSLFAQDNKTEMQPTYEANTQYKNAEMPQYVSNFMSEIRNRPQVFKLGKGAASDPLVAVKLTRNSPYFLITGSKGIELHRFASIIDRKPLENDGEYHNLQIVFPSKDENYVINWCKSLDKDNNKIIDKTEQP